MPCKKYESKRQRNLCFATDEWKDWSGIKKMDLKFKVKRIQTEANKSKGGKIKNGI